jgi:hypothetical protein
MRGYNTVQTFFKTRGQVTALEFGPGEEFNGTRCGTVYKAQLRRQLTDSFTAVIEQRGLAHTPINTLKLTNQSLLTWDDHWVDPSTNLTIDPLIRNLNLQRNSLVYVNISLPRVELTTLNLEGNRDLSHVYIHHAPKLQELNLNGCTALQYITLGENRNIRSLSAKGCRMSPAIMERLLRDFTPAVTSSANDKGVGMFRKTFSSVCDLRGNQIDWGNRRIASKIRLMLCNNWVVRWDNNPPAKVVPPSLYGFFVESQIKV